MTAIQGFPAEASDYTINDVVRELKRYVNKPINEAPPSPPSVVIALAQIKKNGIEKQSLIDSKGHSSTSKSNLFGINNVVSNKTFDNHESVEPTFQPIVTKSQSIKFLAPVKS